MSTIFNWRGNTLSPFSSGQFSNPPFSTPSVNKRWRGTCVFKTVGGLLCAETTNSPPPPATPPWDFCAGTFVRGKVPLVLQSPQTRYYGLAIYRPPQSWYPATQTMLELNFTNVGGRGPNQFVLFRDGHIECWFTSGSYDPNTRQFQFNRTTAPPKIVARTLQPGWNYIVMKMTWATDSRGAGRFYYKAASAGAWSLGDSFSGFATASWMKGKPFPTVGADLLNNYERAVQQKYTICYRRFVVCDTLAEAQTQVALP